MDVQVVDEQGDAGAGAAGAESDVVSRLLWRRVTLPAESIVSLRTR